MAQITMEMLKRLEEKMGSEGTLVYAELMRRAWDIVTVRVADKRGQIDAIVDTYLNCEYSNEVYAHAITFMTGTIPAVTDMGQGKVRFQSIGYRAGPCGDH